MFFNFFICHWYFIVHFIYLKNKNKSDLLSEGKNLIRQDFQIEDMKRLFRIPKKYLEPNRTSKMEPFAKIVGDF